MEHKKQYHLNDKIAKYTSARQGKLQHTYLRLPGKYEKRYPNEIVLPNMDSGRADEIYSVDKGFLINLEEESNVVTENTLKKYYKYKVFASFVYSKGVETVVICNKNPKNFPKEYKKTETDILRPKYIYFKPEELWEKYEKLINKIEQKEELSKNEALNIIFIPKYMPRKDAPFITESMVNHFKDAIINDKELKLDITITLGALILRDIKDVEKQEKLMEMINMGGVKEDIRWALKEEIEEMEEEIREKDNTIQEQGNKLQEKDNTIQEQGNKLQEKDNTIQEQGNKLQEKDHKLQEKDKELTKIKVGLKKVIEDEKTPSELKSIISSLIVVK